MSKRLSLNDPLVVDFLIVPFFDGHGFTMAIKDQVELAFRMKSGRPSILIVDEARKTVTVRSTGQDDFLNVVSVNYETLIELDSALRKHLSQKWVG